MEAAAAPARQLGLSEGAFGGRKHRSGGGGNRGGSEPALVYIAAGRNEVGLWDITSGRCVQVGVEVMVEIMLKVVPMYRSGQCAVQCQRIGRTLMTGSGTSREMLCTFQLNHC